MRDAWLSCLREVDPALADTLEGCRRADASPDIDTSPADPVAWFSSQIPSPNTLILAGTGQADLIAPLLAAKHDLAILLIERDHARLAAALEAIDSEAIREAIRKQRLVLDDAATESRSIDRFLDAADFSRVPRIQLLEARPIDADSYQLAVDATRAARELIRMQTCDLATRLRFGQSWQRNTLLNIPAMVRNTGIKSLFNQFEQKPALVISAGPSLNAAIPLIKANADRFVIICVGRVVTQLREVKIRPDLIVTGDSQALVKKHFRHRAPGVPVVASCFTDPSVTATLDRIFFMEMESMQLPIWLRDRVGELGDIYPGGNVSTAAMAVAVALGCNPILTVGYDLSYPADLRTHATGKPGAAARIYNKLYDVPGNYEPTVQTNRQMLHYIDFAREFVAAHPDNTCININTAGARIEGMQLDTPDHIPDYAADHPLQAAETIARVREAETAEAESRARRVAGMLRDDIPGLHSMRTACIEAAMQCNRLIMLMRRPKSVADAEQTLRDWLDQIKPIDTRLKEDPLMNLIESRIESASHALAERMLSPEERAIPPAIRSHKRWRAFYESVAKACQTTAELLETVADQLAPSDDECNAEQELIKEEVA